MLEILFPKTLMLLAQKVLGEREGGSFSGQKHTPTNTNMYKHARTPKKKNQIMFAYKKLNHSTSQQISKMKTCKIKLSYGNSSYSNRPSTGPNGMLVSSIPARTEVVKQLL